MRTLHATDNRLAVLAFDINTAEAAMRRDARSMAEHALEVGRALLEVKSKLAHGLWETWLAENVSMSARNARRYMQLVTLGIKTDTMADLGLTAAIEAAECARELELAEEFADYLRLRMAAEPKMEERVIEWLEVVDFRDVAKALKALSAKRPRRVGGKSADGSQPAVGLRSPVLSHV